MTNVSHTPNNNKVHQLFREVFSERYKIDLSKKEDGKGSQYVAVEVPKGVEFAKKGSTSLENYASAYVLVSVVAELLGKGVQSDKIGIGIWYRAQGTLIEGILAERGLKADRVVTVGSYLGHDISVWLCDLTGTAHAKKDNVRLLVSGEQLI